MSYSLSHSGGRELDGFADPHVGHAAADTPGHDRVDVPVGWIGIILQQRGGLHDLAWLTITALWNLQFKPRGLQRMLARRIEPLDRGHSGARDCEIGRASCRDRV